MILQFMIFHTVGSLLSKWKHPLHSFIAAFPDRYTRKSPPARLLLFMLEGIVLALHGVG
jgi:hypothetical protein